MIALRLQQGRWSIAAPGVFALAGVPVTWRHRLLAHTLSCGTDSLASHLSAAALLGMPGFREGPIEITVPRGRRLDVCVDRYHQTNLIWNHHTKVVDGISVTSYARTLFDLCGVVHPLRAERAVDTSLARRRVTGPALWTVLIDLAEHGRDGTVVFREILQARGPGYVPPASQLEAEFLALILAAGLSEPAREISLGDADGWIGSVEFVWRPERVLVEVDGDWFHTALLDRLADARRDTRFDRAGYTVVRISYDQLVNDPAEVVRRVRSALRRAA